MSTVLVVGGGVLGLTLADDLARRGHRPIVLESAAAPGGLAGSEAIGGYQWDRFYHVILESDLHLRGLLEQIGLTDALRWGTTRTGFYAQGRLHSLSSSIDYLRFPLLGLVDKARLAATILRAARTSDWQSLEAISVADWLCRWSGRRVFERLWLPLLRSKLGEHWRDTSAAFIWAIIRRMYAARRSGLKTERFGYVDGGYKRILSTLIGSAAAQGVTIRCSAAVSEVRRSDDAAEVILATGERLTADAAVLTVPCGTIATMCPTLSRAERDRLGRVLYLGVACGTALLKRPLANYYVTNITDSGLPFTGVIEMTALVDRSRFGGHSLVYLPQYLPRQDAAWRSSDAELRERFLAGLDRMYPDFSREDVVDFRISRAREVLAVSTLHYSRDAMPKVATSLPGVFIVNSAQIAAGTLNVNETIGVARSGAETVAGALGTPRNAIRVAA
jgi:protoporphyrinogen oxidase